MRRVLWVEYLAMGFYNSWVCHLRVNAGCMHAQRLRLRQGVRIRTIAMGLRLAGHGKMADKLLSGWKVTQHAPGPLSGFQ